MSQKVSYASKRIYPVIYEFSPNDELSNFHICDSSIVTFRIRKNIGLYNTYHVDSLNRFIRSVLDEVKSDMCILQKGYDPKESNMKIIYANNLVHKLGMGDPTTCVYQFIYNKKGKNDTQITQYFIKHILGLCIKVDSYVAHLFYA